VISLDRIGQAPTPPDVQALDLAASRCHGCADALSRGLRLFLGQIRRQDK
jgi:hypothetical protein